MPSDEDVVCYCSHVTKRQIINALNDGAENFEDIKNATGAGTLHKCYICHPKGICCAPDVMSIIDEYKKD